MFCQKCGAQNEDIAMNCSGCGSSLRQETGGMPNAQIPNYLVQAILCTVCCCLPFGIAAIVYAAQVNGKLQAGDYYGAKETSEKAKKWCWAAFISGAIITAAYIILIIIGGLVDKGK